ncbi:uncharacterized protein LOC134232828 [Saccostrea cucullata]|uniref:uncharacterized protein LOC134232828 n=1 Tax=Saccostrea cuccullata TaxID=36930 RepID=UPI002ED07B3C
MFFQRCFFILIFLIVKTMGSARNCSWSFRTLHVVSSCPFKTDEKLMAEKIKKCEGLASLQDCSGPSLFKYHCVLNEDGDEFLEVCAPEVKIVLGHCATFSISNGRIKQHFNRTCNRGTHPCPLQYVSSESYKYPTCYGFPDNYTIYEATTETINIDACSEEKRNQLIISLTFLLVSCIYISTLPLILSRNCRRSCLKHCPERFGWFLYRSRKRKEKNPSIESLSSIPLQEMKDCEEKKDIRSMKEMKSDYRRKIEIVDKILSDLTTEKDTSGENVKDYKTEKDISTLEEKFKEIKELKKAAFSNLHLHRELHPFPKQKSSLCIRNISSVNHISHISERTIWLSNRKHVMEIDHNGCILRYFKMDDVSGSASHTIDGDGKLFFIRDNKVYKVQFKEPETIFLDPPQKVLSIYYSKVRDEIILGTYNMLGISIHSKLTRYSKEGMVIIEIESYEGENLYVLPMFISENVNGDVCTADCGTSIVTGVSRLGNLLFKYDGNRTQVGFYPTGVCYDVYGHLIVCNRHDANPSIHVLNYHGHFLTLILTDKDGIKDPYGLCVSKDGSLYLGQHDSNTVAIYQYLDGK